MSFPTQSNILHTLLSKPIEENTPNWPLNSAPKTNTFKGRLVSEVLITFQPDNVIFQNHIQRAQQQYDAVPINLQQALTKRVPQQHNPEMQYLYICDCCNICYENVRSLNKHITQKHPTIENNQLPSTSKFLEKLLEMNISRTFDVEPSSDNQNYNTLESLAIKSKDEIPLQNIEPSIGKLDLNIKNYLA